MGGAAILLTSGLVAPIVAAGVGGLVAKKAGHSHYVIPDPLSPTSKLGMLHVMFHVTQFTHNNVYSQSINWVLYYICRYFFVYR